MTSPSDTSLAGRLRAERDEARSIVRDIFWMALRYADGRMTYAVGMVNDAVKKGYDAGWITSKDTGGDPITPRFARDGMAPEWKSIESRITALEARNRELEAGLLPFAGMAVSSINCRDDSWQIRIPETEPQPTFAMFEAARALLPSPTGDRK